jgi:hypothetical protein
MKRTKDASLIFPLLAATHDQGDSGEAKKGI